MVKIQPLQDCAFRGIPFTTTSRKCRRLALSTSCSSTPGPANLLRRRDLLAATLLFSCQLGGKRADGASNTEAPPTGDCPECIGEVNGGLNACTLDSTSCVSTQNDDEAHFVPPWQYDGGTDKAIQFLIDTATGGTRTAVSDASGAGITLKDSASYTFKEVEASLTGGPFPKKPQPQRKNTVAVCFDGRLVDKHTTSDGSEYLHMVFGEGADGATCRDVGVIDAELIFLAADNVVDIRTASRVPPGLQGGAFSLSLSTGVSYDTNVAKRQMEELRKALRWEAAPVVTDFDPRFNQRRPLFFERLYQPFLQNKQDFEPIVDK